MMSTLIGWWIYEITGSLLSIGLIGIAEVLPTLGFSLFAGYIIDKSEKRKLLLKCVFVYGICVLLFLALPVLLLENPKSINIIIIAVYFIIFCMGCVKAFLAPTFNAIMPSIISKPIISKATTISTATWLFGSIAGHAVAGFSIAYMGVFASIVIIATLIFGSFFMLLLILPRPASLQIVDNTPKWSHIKQGIQFVYKDTVMLSSISLDLFTVFFGGIVSIIPAVAKDILKVDIVGFAWLNLASDLGSGIMLLILMFVPLRTKQGMKLFLTIAVFGCSIIVFSYSQSLIISFIALFISGLANSVNSVIRGTIMQIKTPDNMRGRVMGINSLFTNSSNELGRVESSLAAYYMGIMPSILFGGTMTLLFVLITYVKTPELRKLEY